MEAAPPPFRRLTAGAATTEALRAGDLVAEHLRSLPAMFGALAVQGPLALSAFFVRFAAGRRGLLADPPVAYAATLFRVFARAPRLAEELAPAGQLRFSRWWLARHRYGPVEWVLRAVTNAERPDDVPR